MQGTVVRLGTASAGFSWYVLRMVGRHFTAWKDLMYQQECTFSGATLQGYSLSTGVRDGILIQGPMNSPKVFIQGLIVLGMADHTSFVWLILQGFPSDLTRSGSGRGGPQRVQEAYCRFPNEAHR